MANRIGAGRHGGATGWSRRWFGVGFVALFTLAGFGCAPSSLTDQTQSVAQPGAYVANFPRSTAQQQGIAAEKITSLDSTAAAQHSSALIVARNGAIIHENYFGDGDRALLAMSASKSFVSMAYGLMLADGTIASLDDKIVKYVPNFAAVDSRKASMTIRHLLSMTSGLQPTRAFAMGNDIDRLGIESKVLFEPGRAWHYSNNAVDFLAALAVRISGKQIDVLLEERLFRPLGISGVTWGRDARGTPYGAGEMSIRPSALLRVGQMLLDGGRWQGTQIVSPEWIAQASVPSSSMNAQYGLLWWRDVDATAYALNDGLVSLWESFGMARPAMSKLTPMFGRTYTVWDDYRFAIRGLLTTSEVDTLNAVLFRSDHPQYALYPDATSSRAFYFAGWLGQYLYVNPDTKVVALRMRRGTEADYLPNATERDAYASFTRDVRRLLQ